MKTINAILKYILLVNYFYTASLVCILFAFFGWVLGVSTTIFILIAVTLLWMGNILECKNWRYTTPFLIFNMAFFLFLIPRPWFNIIYKLPDDKDPVLNQGAPTALLMMYLSLATIAVLHLLTTRYVLPKITQKNLDIFAKCQVKHHFWQLLIIFWGIFYICTIIRSIEIFTYTKSHSYFAYYASFQSVLPKIVVLISGFWTILTVLILAFAPPKKYLAIIFIGGSINYLIIMLAGKRNPLTLFILFFITYLVVRYRKEIVFSISKRGKVLIALIACFTILSGAITMNLISVKRGDGNNYPQLNKVEAFFYNQSVSYNLLARGSQEYKRLPNYGHAIYTFSSPLERFKQSKLNWSTSKTKYPKLQTREYAFESNALDPAYSYLFFKEGYFAGHGSGSSYLIENYIDFGYLGVILSSFLIGILLQCFSFAWGRSWIINSFLLSGLYTFYMLPRASTFGYLDIIYSPRFYICLLLVFYLYRKYRIDEKQQFRRES